VSSFEDFVDVEGLDPAERERLRRVHELLLEAGPPPELPASLDRPPTAVTGPRVLAFPARRRLAAALVLAAALAAAAFGGGYAVGHHGGGGSTTVREATLSGQNAFASLRVSAPDAGDNWPIKVHVSGLPKLAGEGSYYELFVSRNGKPSLPCGGFKVRATGATTVTFTVPYEVDKTTTWVLTAVGGHNAWPGRVVMTQA